MNFGVLSQRILLHNIYGLKFRFDLVKFIFSPTYEAHTVFLSNLLIVLLFGSIMWFLFKCSCLLRSE